MSGPVKLSDFVMQFLVERGVRHVFMLPGGGAMHLDDSLGRRGDLEYICFLHEQALAIAAEAYGQHTDRPGVGLVTSGPGGTNAVTGVAAAYFDSTPCLFISGQAKRADLKRDTGVRQMGSQEVDIVSVVSAITKYAAMVTEPADIRYQLERAWYEATSGRKGPVWLDIPLDVQAAAVDPGVLRSFEPPPPVVADAESPARAVARMLASAERPLLLAGNGVKLAGAQADLLRVVETTQVPFLLTWKTIDLVGHEHPLFFGCPGIMGCRTANFLVQNCDVLLVVGGRLDPSLTAFDVDAFGRHAERVVVDIDEAEVRKLGDVELPVVMDAGAFLRALAAQTVTHGERSGWLGYARAMRDRYPVVLDEYLQREDIDLYAFTKVLFDHLAADDVIVPESSGAAGEITYQAMCVRQGQKVRNAAGLGAMGFGLPYAIGACVANDRRRYGAHQRGRRVPAEHPGAGDGGQAPAAGEDVRPGQRRLRQHPRDAAQPVRRALCGLVSGQRPHVASPERTRSGVRAALRGGAGCSRASGGDSAGVGRR